MLHFATYMTRDCRDKASFSSAFGAGLGRSSNAAAAAGLKACAAFPFAQEDWIGLQELDERGRVVFDEIPGAHMHFTLQYFEENVVKVYLKGNDLGGEQGASAEPLSAAR